MPAGEMFVDDLCRPPVRKLRASRRSGGDQYMRELRAIDADVAA